MLITRRVLLAFTLSLAASAQQNLDSVVQRALTEFEVPGIAVAVVKDGQIVLAKGYGVKRLGDPSPVTSQTLFGIASNTKAFTAASLAILVDEGKLKWDDPVIQHLPAFEMYDPYVTREMTVRDLLCHRSGLGLGAGDLMFWPNSDLTPQQVLSRLRFIRPATSFRSRYAYDNILYIVSGQLIQAVSGKPWQEFVNERILQPLGMNATRLSGASAATAANVASPHAKADGKLTAVKSDLDSFGPAGALWSSVDDMSKWVTLQLNRGTSGSTKVFSERQSREMWSPQTIIPLPAAEPTGVLAAARANFQAYGLGWVLSDYRGRKIVHHTGGMLGTVTRVTLVPELKLGVIVFTNQEVGVAFNAVTYTILDHYLGAPPSDWVEAYSAAQKKREAESAASVKKAEAARNANSKPSLPLSSYANRYRDAWYGDIAITEASGKLAIRFTHTPDLTGDLEHFQYDTFIVRWRDRSLNADAYITFSLKPDGSIEQAKMSAVSSATDFSFDFHDLLLVPAPKDAPAFD
jgi:CubicO group peptidase (beta-lactamase class C family)